MLLHPPSWPGFVALPFEYEGLRAVAMAADYMKDISIWRKRNMKDNREIGKAFVWRFFEHVE